MSREDRPHGGSAAGEQRDAPKPPQRMAAAVLEGRMGGGGGKNERYRYW